ncbi:hypothetical protein BpHYR1_023918 [Brachionus plicatilis]|uniref:Uncharacterized protein n=1 Tax=Brachionus plicatilis TaxID=10195 RepID=A0A3M7R6G5_BRAPC|nr:hypothetical protein BpHYR1_023918 [Brachionus plicatilis]
MKIKTIIYFKRNLHLKLTSNFNLALNIELNIKTQRCSTHTHHSLVNQPMEMLLSVDNQPMEILLSVDNHSEDSHQVDVQILHGYSPFKFSPSKFSPFKISSLKIFPFYEYAKKIDKNINKMTFTPVPLSITDQKSTCQIGTVSLKLLPPKNKYMLI